MIDVYYKWWKQGANPALATQSFPGWPGKGIAVLGDFSGIQNFVYRPVPGAKGAARRLRSRSFHVSAYTELVARWCLGQLAASRAKLLYSAGGRFLAVTEPFADWQQKIAGLQAEIDAWAWVNFEGELSFHLAAVCFQSGRIPSEALSAGLQRNRGRALQGVLHDGKNWRESEFVRSARPGEDRCDSCAATQAVELQADGARICKSCSVDESVGSRLPKARCARFVSGVPALVTALHIGLELENQTPAVTDKTVLALGAGATGLQPWLLLRHTPTRDGNALDFEEIAQLAPGHRKWLGCLRIDADNVGRSFAGLNGDPARVWGLSQLLHHFFAGTAEQLLEEKFPSIYAVYGGGDDLFVIGPWTEALDFACELRAQLRAVVGDDLTFSAGLSLAKPKEHILSMARQAGDELEKAKTRRNQIRALDTSCDWDTFSRISGQAKQVARWLQAGDIPSRFLHQALALHRAWEMSRKSKEKYPGLGLVRYRPLLYYQICRNLKPQSPSAQWAHSLLQPSSDWPWMAFIARYALLAADGESQEE